MKPSGEAGMMLAKLVLTVGVVSAVVIFQVDGSNWKFWSVWAAFPETFRPPEELRDHSPPHRPHQGRGHTPSELCRVASDVIFWMFVLFRNLLL